MGDAADLREMPELKTTYREALWRGLEAAVAAGNFITVARAYDLPAMFVGLLSARLLLSASSDRSLSTAMGSAIAPPACSGFHRNEAR